MLSCRRIGMKASAPASTLMASSISFWCWSKTFFTALFFRSKLRWLKLCTRRCFSHKEWKVAFGLRALSFGQDPVLYWQRFINGTVLIMVAVLMMVTLGSFVVTCLRFTPRLLECELLEHFVGAGRSCIVAANSQVRSKFRNHTMWNCQTFHGTWE